MVIVVVVVVIARVVKFAHAWIDAPASPKCCLVRNCFVYLHPVLVVSGYHATSGLP